jgi:hypothetical protein
MGSFIRSVEDIVARTLAVSACVGVCALSLRVHATKYSSGYPALFGYYLPVICLCYLYII